jgi:hypothetical protein
MATNRQWTIQGHTLLSAVTAICALRKKPWFRLPPHAATLVTVALSRPTGIGAYASSHASSPLSDQRTSMYLKNQQAYNQLCKRCLWSLTGSGTYASSARGNNCRGQRNTRTTSETHSTTSNQRLQGSTLVCSSSRKVSGLTPTEVFCPSHSQKPH